MGWRPSLRKSFWLSWVNAMDEKYKKSLQAEYLLGGMGWLMLLVILLLLVVTVLHLNQVIVWPLFDSYLPLSLSIFFGLVIWGIRFYLNSRKYPSYLRYSAFALVFALIQLIFLLAGVY